MATSTKLLLLIFTPGTYLLALHNKGVMSDFGSISLQKSAEDYFASISPLAKRIMEERTIVKNEYEEEWDFMSYDEQEDAIYDYFVSPKVQEKYSSTLKLGGDTETFPKLLLHPGSKIIVEESESQLDFSYVENPNRDSIIEDRKMRRELIQQRLKNKIPRKDVPKVSEVDEDENKDDTDNRVNVEAVLQTQLRNIELNNQVNCEMDSEICVSDEEDIALPKSGFDFLDECSQKQKVPENGDVSRKTARCSAQQVAAILDSDDEETLGFDEDYPSDELETDSDDNVDNDNDSESDSDNENPVDRLPVRPVIGHNFDSGWNKKYFGVNKHLDNITGQRVFVQVVELENDNNNDTKATNVSGKVNLISSDALFRRKVKPKNMVLTFRVSELQVLLGFAGRNKSGRKPELQHRALELTCLKSTPIMMKIRELYRRREQTTHQKNNSELMSVLEAGSMKPCPNYVPSSRSYNSITPSSSVNYRSDRLMGAGPEMNGGNISYPVHPDVRLKTLPFYDTVAELIRPTSLVPSGNNVRYQESHFVIHLTPQQAQNAAMSREIRTSHTGARMEHYNTQIQLRFCYLETSCEQDDNFPPNICVKVNEKVCPLPNFIPTNKPGVEPKRPGKPVNITCLCKLSPIVANYIDVTWTSDVGRGFVFAAYLVNKVTSTTLLSRLKSSGMRSADHTRALIKEKLSHDMDSEIATTSLKVSLMCPLGKSRMQLPCRASTCTHIQCFDAMLFLQMNEKKATWVCPVCDQTALFDKLMIDGLFLEIVREAPSTCNEVKFAEDGSWSPLIAKKESQSSVQSSPSKVKIYDIIADVIPKKKPSLEVVDLTLSSDDEPDDNVTKSTNQDIKDIKPCMPSSLPYLNPYQPSRLDPALVDISPYKSRIPSSASEWSEGKDETDNKFLRLLYNNIGSSANIAPNLSTSLSTSQEKLLPPPLTNSMGYYNTVPSLSSMEQDLNQLGVPPTTSPYSSEYLSNNSMFSQYPTTDFDLYSLLHISGVDSQRSSSQQMMSSRGNPTSNQSSSSNVSTVEESPPDIIPLD
ncbi:E3 SUMO-protein ligase PIAS1 [Nymphon striatum]|nr:E3 SUMO-protein ligase PIAS1 [Nymphon striatum]